MIERSTLMLQHVLARISAVWVVYIHFCFCGTIVPRQLTLPHISLRLIFSQFAIIRLQMRQMCSPHVDANQQQGSDDKMNANLVLVTT